ncbi:hypothetical protein M5K25_001003 [Dendrobium thyrsiflorum]|uniref:Uncharacterized protein n=1 Tax=Dendrobium thyrsiflorum TaxID=117978 RepID=A0ABD0VYB1_DENTH
MGQSPIFRSKTGSRHWYRDFRWESEMKDEEVRPAFPLMNKAAEMEGINTLPSVPLQDGRYQYSAISSITV